jgi:hypothetical protein
MTNTVCRGPSTITPGNIITGAPAAGALSIDATGRVGPAFGRAGVALPVGAVVGGREGRSAAVLSPAPALSPALPLLLLLESPASVVLGPAPPQPTVHIREPTTHHVRMADIDARAARAGKAVRRRAERLWCAAMPTPAKPRADVRDKLLGQLAEIVARCGAGQFLLPPVAPGGAAFPEPWAPTKVGVQLLLRRLAWHAGIERQIVIDDQRVAAPPTERKPATRVELVEVRGRDACFVLGFVGSDDVAGTLALEIGTLHAVVHRPDGPDPYRSAEPPVLTPDPDRDAERGGVAAVYAGLGVLAANAAYQQYSSPGRFNGGYVPHEYDVLRAGALPLSSLAYLVAVQAVVRGDVEPPAGLGSIQLDEVSAWMRALAGERRVLADRLGIDVAAQPGAREVPVAFGDHEAVEEEAPRKTAFRWQTNRGGIGLLAGAALGFGVGVVASPGLLLVTAVGGAISGHLVGRMIDTPRCSACATVVREGATSCPRCNAMLRGDIANLSERLEAEERLEQESGTDM